MDLLQPLHRFQVGHPTFNGLKSPAMANPEHLAILKKGGKVWNPWRANHLDIPLNWKRADLSRADLSTANLAGAILDDAILEGADLSECNLYEASFREARLTEAKLCTAYLHRVNLNEADLREADCKNAILWQTVFGRTNLRRAKNLSKCRFVGPCTIDLHSIETSWPLPLDFLRGCGLPDDYIKWLLQRQRVDGVRFHSCFISFGNTDASFAHRLYTNLQDKGVRCWFFPENAKWGGTVWGEIGKGIQDYDRLLVICSEASLESGPVNREIERALQKEDREGKPVLFPITLDRFLFDEWEHERKPDVLAKIVGDFTDWKNPDSYRKAFERLLRDLKADMARKEV